MLDFSRNQTLGTIDCGETVLSRLQWWYISGAWLQSLTFNVNWNLAYPTAVLLEDGSVICLFENMESSIPADDNKGVPRADGFFHGEWTWKKPDKIGFETAKKIVWVAAYRLVQSPWIVENNEARVAEVVS